MRLDAAEDQRAAGRRAANSGRSADEQRAGQVRGHDVGIRQRPGGQVEGLERHVADVRVQPEVLARRLNRVRVVIDAQHPPGAQAVCGNGQHAGPGADVENHAVGDVDCLQRGKTQPRRHVMAGAEAHGGEDDDGQRGQI